VSVMNALVQTFVWMTIARCLYLVWLYRQSTSPIHVFELSRQRWRVLELLQSARTATSIVLLITTFVLALPMLWQVYRSPALTCTPSPSQAHGSDPIDSTAAISSSVRVASFDFPDSSRNGRQESDTARANAPVTVTTPSASGQRARANSSESGTPCWQPTYPPDLLP